MTELVKSPIESFLDKEVPKDLSWEGQLKFLQGFSNRFGALHEAQAMQLRYWPYTVDASLPDTGQEARVDFEGGLVQYSWTDPGREPGWKPDEDYKKRLKYLAKWTRWMLGKKFRVEVLLNNETIFVKNRERPKKRK